MEEQSISRSSFMLLGKLEVLLVQCSSEDQLADILTKLLFRNRFEKMRSLIGMMSLEEFAVN